MEKLYDTELILKNYSDDKEFIKNMVGLFIKHLPEWSAGLQKASLKKDWKKIYFYAHTMKASIDLFSIASLTDLIRKLEKQGLNEISSQTLKEDVEYVSDIISACVVQLKNDFALA